MLMGYDPRGPSVCKLPNGEQRKQIFLAWAQIQWLVKDARYQNIFNFLPQESGKCFNQKLLVIQNNKLHCIIFKSNINTLQMENHHPPRFLSPCHQSVLESWRIQSRHMIWVKYKQENFAIFSPLLFSPTFQS